MFIHEIDINILNYGVLFLGGYQDKYKNWDLYQYMNDFFGVGNRNCGARYSWNN